MQSILLLILFGIAKYCLLFSNHDHDRHAHDDDDHDHDHFPGFSTEKELSELDNTLSTEDDEAH